MLVEERASAASTRHETRVAATTPSRGHDTLTALGAQTGVGCMIVCVPNAVTTDLLEMQRLLSAFDDRSTAIHDADQLDRIGTCAAHATQHLGDTDLDRSVAMCILTATRATAEAREAAANHRRLPMLRAIARAQFDARIDTATGAIAIALADLGDD